MKTRKTLAITLFIMTAVFFTLVASPVLGGQRYAINEVISMSPGESQQREFVVNDVFDLRILRPIESYVIVATGEAGTLSISLEADPDLDFAGLMDYSLVGLGYSLDAGMDFIYESATSPFEITRDVAIDSTFGFVYAGTIITSLEKALDSTVPFVITFELSEAEAE